MFDIITFGSATQDVFMSSNEFKVVEDDKFITKKGLCVPLGSKMHMENVFFSMGGNGANASVTFAKQGMKTAYVGQVGKDTNGQIVRQTLSENNVSLDFLKEIDSQDTSYSVIISLPGVGRSILEKLGASHKLTTNDIPFDKIKTKWIYLSSMPGESHQTFGSIIDFARKNKIKLAVNPGKTQLTDGLEQLRSLVGEIDIIFVNQEEAAILTGVDYGKEKEIFKKLKEMVRGVAVMTKGPEGVIVSDGQYQYSAGIPKSDLIDRTGAGDAFSSAFTSGYIEQSSIEYAIQLGTANATSCLQKMGAVNGLLEKDNWGPWPKVKVEII